MDPAIRDAIQLVMERDDVDEPEALRRLVGYGDLVYRTVRVDGGEILTRHGWRQDRVILADEGGRDPTRP